MSDIKQAIQELRPCPFCGGTPTIRQDIVKYSDEDVWIIECRHNGCLMGPEIENPNRIEAIAAWNTRVSPEREALEKIRPLLQEVVDTYNAPREVSQNFDWIEFVERATAALEVKP